MTEPPTAGSAERLPGVAMPGWLGALLGDLTVADALSANADLAAMLQFEAALARAQAEQGLIPQDSADAIEQACDRFVADTDALAAATVRDGVVVPGLLNQLRATLPESARPHLHMGATSQDVVDTALVLRLQRVFDQFEVRLQAITEDLNHMRTRDGQRTLTGRTRMQAALTITVAQRIDDWCMPLEACRQDFHAVRAALSTLQLGGPVGDIAVFGDRADAVHRRVAELLDLNAGPCWHVRRQPLVRFAHWCVLVTGTLGKLGTDITLMAQQGIDAVRLRGGGSSSAMPHKQNPVAAEQLVMLSHWVGAQSAGLQQSLLSEQERSGAAWMLEWALLPGILHGSGASLRTALALIDSIEALGDHP